MYVMLMCWWNLVFMLLSSWPTAGHSAPRSLRKYLNTFLMTFHHMRQNLIGQVWLTSKQRMTDFFFFFSAMWWTSILHSFGLLVLAADGACDKPFCRQTHISRWQEAWGFHSCFLFHIELLLLAVLTLFVRGSIVDRAYRVVVVVPFSLLARILGACSTIHSLPAVCLFFEWRIACAH